MNRNALAVAVALAACAIAAPAGHASSIVYSKRNAIYIASPDGKRHLRLVHDRKYSSPSQANDGTIVALSDDNRLYRFSRRGKRLNKPVSTWLGPGGGQGFSPPYSPRVSPDGKKVAYTFFHTGGVDQIDGNSATEGATAYTYSNRYTPPGRLGIVKGWYHPSWLGNSVTISFAPGVGGYDSGPTTVAYHQLGHADPSATDDLAHAYTSLGDRFLGRLAGRAGSRSPIATGPRFCSTSRRPRVS